MEAPTAVLPDENSVLSAPAPAVELRPQQGTPLASYPADPLAGRFLACFVSPGPLVRTGTVLGEVADGHYAVQFDADAHGPSVAELFTTSEIRSLHLFETAAQRQTFLANAAKGATIEAPALV